MPAPEGANMHIPRLFEALRLNLSTLLRYSYGGFLLIATASIVAPSAAEDIAGTLSWELAVITALVLGVGLYAAHRSLAIWLDHLLLCLILSFAEGFAGISPFDSSSPTRWLGSIGVPWFRRMTAYTIIRRSDFFPNREALDVAHAEIGLVVMTSEALLLGALFVAKYPDADKWAVGWWPLFLVGVGFLVASYPGTIEQHRVECWEMRRRWSDIANILRRSGVL